MNLMVVILGISIAFYMEGYREAKANRALERKYIESLITDLNADIAALDTLTGLNQMINGSIVALLEASDEKPYTNPTKFRNDLLGILYNPPFEPQRTVYESIKSSGQINVLSDFELGKQVTELYEQYYRGTYQYDEVLTDHVNTYIKPYLLRETKLHAAVVDNGFLADPVFQNTMFTYRYLFSAKNAFYGEVKTQAEQLKSSLESYLEQL